MVGLCFGCDSDAAAGGAGAAPWPVWLSPEACPSEARVPCALDLRVAAWAAHFGCRFAGGVAGKEGAGRALLSAGAPAFVTDLQSGPRGACFLTLGQ